jgi:hypothetical protein
MHHPAGRYSLAHLSYKLNRTVRRRATKALADGLAFSRLGRIGIPLNLYEIVTVVARVPT